MAISFNGGVEIIIDGKSLKVSHHVADIFGLIEKILKPDTNEETKLACLEKILKIAERESSMLTSHSSSAFFRDEAVWKFFERMNESLIIKPDAIAKFDPVKSI